MKRKLRKLVLKWKARIWLQRWHIELFYEDPKEEPEGAGALYWDSNAVVNLRPDYFKAGLTLRPEKKDFDEKSWDRTICHELVHIANSPLTEFAREVIDELPERKRAGFERWLHSLNEQVTEHWTNVLMES